MDNHEFFVETYKPFDEYLKKHKYDPKTNTIEIDGKRESIRTDFSPKERNRINKFLRENDYDPKTETIRTDSIDPRDPSKTRRVKFDMRSNTGGRGPNYNHNDKVINQTVTTISKKPSSSNSILKHEEGHFDDRQNQNDINDLEKKISSIKEKIYEAYPDEKKRLYKELNKYERQLKTAKSHKNDIDDIKDKAFSFNQKQYEESNVRQNERHDISPSENYADYYGAKYNKSSNKKDKEILGTLNNIRHKHGKTKLKANIQKIIDEKDIIALTKLFANNFYSKRSAMEKSGCLKELNISYDDLEKYYNLIELIESIDKQRHWHESRVKQTIEKDIRNKYESKLKELHEQQDELWFTMTKEEELKSKEINDEIKALDGQIKEEVDKSMEDFRKSDDEYKKLSNQIEDLKHKTDAMNPVKNISSNQMRKAVIKANEYISSCGSKSRQDFVNSINEMYLSNIITESEYVQLQERIQILTERSE